MYNLSTNNVRYIFLFKIFSFYQPYNNLSSSVSHTKIRDSVTQGLRDICFRIDFDKKKNSDY